MGGAANTKSFLPAFLIWHMASSAERALREEERVVIPLGVHAWVNLIQLDFEVPVPEYTLVSYDLGVLSDDGEGAAVSWTGDWAPYLCRPGTTDVNRRPGVCG